MVLAEHGPKKTPPDDEKHVSRQTKREDDDEKKTKKQRRGMKRITDVHAYLKQKTPKEIFEEFDVDDSGLIDQEEFLAMIEALQFKLPEAKALYVIPFSHSYRRKQG